MGSGCLLEVVVCSSLGHQSPSVRTLLDSSFQSPAPSENKEHMRGILERFSLGITPVWQEAGMDSPFCAFLVSLQKRLHNQRIRNEKSHFSKEFCLQLHIFRRNFCPIFSHFPKDFLPNFSHFPEGVWLSLMNRELLFKNSSLHKYDITNCI